MTSKRTAVWALLGLVVAAVAATFLVPGPLDLTEGTIVIGFLVVTSAVGALLAIRLPGHPVGWLMLATSVCFAMGGLLVTYVEAALVEEAEPVSISAWMVIVANCLFGIGSGIASTFLLLLFPTGRLPSPRWKPVTWLAAIGLVSLLAGLALSNEAYDGLPIENPVALDPSQPLVVALEGGGFYALMLAVLASALSLVFRYRQARPIERQQLKLVALAVVAVALGALVPAVWEVANGNAELSDDLENMLFTATLALVPTAIGVAILRYRLYDIDRIISRTVTYALVVGTLSLIVAMLAGMAGTRFDDPLIVAVTTLTVAAIFNPLRRRVQALVDRRFNRSRYDAERIVHGFSGTLQGRVDADDVVSGWTRVVSDTMQPRAMGVWVRQ